METIEQSIKYTFKDKQLLKKALTHTSYAYEKNIESNEKLEFLGDSILEYIASEYIYHTYPKLKEGEMTKVRATVVCGENLAKVAKTHNIGEYLYLGNSEIRSGGKNRIAILEDTVEALIAAIYLDGGINPVKKFIIRNLEEEIENATKNVGVKEILQENGDVKIQYEIIKEMGPDHDKSFIAQVKLNGKILAKGEGKSKQKAEMQAAKKAINEIKRWSNEKAKYNPNFDTRYKIPI